MEALLPPPPSPPHPPHHHHQRIDPQQQQHLQIDPQQQQQQIDLQHHRQQQINPQQQHQQIDLQHHRQQQIDAQRQHQQIDDVCTEDNPRKLLRWTKNETLLLLTAKRKREDGLLILSAGADEKVSDVNKWKRICDSLRAHGVDRDHVACKKRWFHLLSDYKKIQDWQCAAGAAESFWLMQPHERRAKRLPSGFDRDIYGELDSWLGGRPAVNPSAILESTIGNGEGTLDFEVENDPLPDLSDRNGLRSYGISGYHKLAFNSFACNPFL
ncbi:hypothetical protein O6H91_Y064300 [Diphasiastrum complanatum]|nr:hypothetical protein O6H91_Y064300 [Diphasiastrum complanatum]